MNRRRNIAFLIPAGLIMMSAGLIYHNWSHADRADFFSGALIGMALVFMIAGFVIQKRQMPKS